MKNGTESKLKFKRLKRRLGLSLMRTVGLLETMWLVTYQNAPDGDIGRLSNEDIAAAIEWDEDEIDANELIQALVECRWLDTDSEFRLIIHDWSDHCAGYLKGAYSRHGKLFADQTAKQRALATCSSNLPPPPSTLPPSQSQPIPANPSQFNPSQQGVLSNSAGTKAGKGAGVFANMTEQVLRDPTQLDAWWVDASSRRKPIVGKSEADRLRVFGAAERAIENGDDPVKLFAYIVSKHEWKLISLPQEDRANARIKSLSNQRSAPRSGQNGATTVSNGPQSMAEILGQKNRGP